ncbi:hypothetical protein CKO51_27240 [Rhodopirellula sp. SM50]|nr:AAA family ATPase [Rhodopirellula sp. SM50]PAY16350.1 hypothetical protein CKO51_27240 [Rhodopirellula sp. SM50]
MEAPVWIQNLRKAILLDPLVILHGNVRDLFYLESEKVRRLPQQMSAIKYAEFSTWLALELENQGFELVVFYDAVDEAVVLRRAMAERFRELASPKSRNQDRKSIESPKRAGPSLPTASPDVASDSSTEVADADWMVKLDESLTPENFVQTLKSRILNQAETPVAVIFRFTDRYLSFSDRQDKEEKRLSILLQKAAMSIPASRNPEQPQSRIFMLFDLEGAVPQELGVQAPFAGSARIPIPSQEDRELFIRSNAEQFYSEPGQRFDPERDLAELIDFANLSDGLRTQDLLSLSALSHAEQLGLGKDQFRSLIDRFRFGTRENAWLKIKNETLRNAADQLRKRVKGQDAVIDEVVPTLIRAKLGLTEISSKGHSSKPRGVFFFVGPTGVGKTELTKAIAELIFGDENSMARFDMSEYSEEHQQARLVGAPPGYVGFDQGGQLPNAILEQPFSVILFDEVEKAHGRILDKFLQILDDGRLTDGMGRTVYFSEAIIIFTSNIGTSQRFRSSGSGARQVREIPSRASSTVGDHYDRLNELSYDELCTHFRSEVHDFFVNQLGRPEILNRIGEDNILVFNFLNDGTVKDAIIQKQVEDLANYLLQKFKVSVELTRPFREVLKQHPNGFQRNGARGVRNLLRKLVLDKVAMDIFTNGDNLIGQRLVVDYAAKMSTIESSFVFDRKKVRHDWRLA